MQYSIRIEGISPLIMHNGAAGLDTRSPISIEIAEITAKKGSNRTATDDERLAQLECQRALYLNSKGTPTIPEAVLRSNIEKGARKLKQGPQVREGLVVSKVTAFIYDVERYGKEVEEIGRKAQFTCDVVVGRNRILRTRAMFEDWACEFEIDADDELVDAKQLATWLDIGGRRVGLGDWRPEKSGHYGRYVMKSLDES